MEDLRKQVISMQPKVRDLLDDPGHSAARRLVSEMQALEDDMQVGKNARSVEDRVKNIIRLLEGEARSARIMDYAHIDMLRGWFENLRTSVARLI